MCSIIYGMKHSLSTKNTTGIEPGNVNEHYQSGEMPFTELSVYD